MIRRMFAVLLFLSACSGSRPQTFETLSTWDLSERKLTAAQLQELGPSELSLLRGIVFGRYGRIFKDTEIANYLKTQSWYKPSPTFQNSVLNPTERANLDLIRELEANMHDTIEPGDLRWWQNRPIDSEKLGTHSAAEWVILRAEVEAIHGRTFDEEPWLKKYFEDRYWYAANPAYNVRQLSATERKNLEVIDAGLRKERHAAISPGDMEHFEDRRVEKAMLEGLSLHELRILRNEVYARQGRRFRSEWLQLYFSGEPWYDPRDDNREPPLTPVQKSNIETIAAYEKELKDSLSQKPLPQRLLEGMFLEDARRLREEIYARHGKVFETSRTQKYFSSFDWYRVNPDYSDALLNAVELRTS
jgi:hypothetical protein